MTAPLGAIQTTGGLQPPPGQRNLSMAAATGVFTLSGVAASPTATISGIHAFTLSDGHNDTLYIGNAFTGQSVYAAPGLLISNQPTARIEYKATTPSEQQFDIVGTDTRVGVRAQKSDLSGVNPEIVLADLTAAFGVPVFGGHNQAGIGLVWNGVPATSAGALNIANLGGGGSGEFNSCIINIWGGSPSGDTQNIITFFNATGPGQWDNVMGATPAGARLGEICGCGTLPDGNFTQTETWSINGYSEALWTGTTGDGTYSAPSNIVLRAASAYTPSTSPLVGPERITAIFDYRANLLIGDDTTGKDAFTAFGNAASGYTKNSLIFRNAGGDPSNQYASGGILYVHNGALKYKGSTGTVTTIANA